MKKILISTGVFVFAFTLTAGSALAWGHYRYEVQSNYAHSIKNYTESFSSTGGNDIGKADINGNATINTGYAKSSAEGTNAVNSNWSEMTRMDLQRNRASGILNGVGAYSDTGDNAIGKADIGGRRAPGSATINTGNAVSSASGMNLVNSNVKMGGSWAW